MLPLLILLCSAYLVAGQIPLPPASSPGNVANNTREFRLKTSLRPNQTSKARFNNLWLAPWTLTKGFPNEYDAVFDPVSQYAIVAYVNYTDGPVGQLTFDLGEKTPWTMIDVDNQDFASWGEMRLDRGFNGISGFYINQQGLRWNSDFRKGVDGTNAISSNWIGADDVAMHAYADEATVCEWWREARPQLFWKSQMYDEIEVPCSCAEVYLIPEYL